MQIVLNGETREITSGLTVRGLLSLLALENEPVAVERNESIVPRAAHEACVLIDGDRLEIVQFVGGG